MFVISPTVKSFGSSIHDRALNRSIRQSRNQNRKQLAAEISQYFSTAAYLTVHWDGKLLPDLTSKKSVDCHAMLVSYQAETKLLFSPKLLSVTGKAEDLAVCCAIKQWCVEKNEQAMCLAWLVQLPEKNVACVFVKQTLGRDL